MQFIRVKVRRSEYVTHNSLVRPWEVPILELLFEQGNVVKEGVEYTDEPYPEPAVELARLRTAYGTNEDTGIPEAVTVYGDGPRGVKALAEVIEDVKRTEEAERKPAAASRKPRAQRAAADPLMA